MWGPSLEISSVLLACRSMGLSFRRNSKPRFAALGFNEYLKIILILLKKKLFENVDEILTSE